MTPLDDWAHKTAFEASPASVSLARDFVGDHLLAHVLPHLVEDVRLVASELATNAVQHACTAFAVSLSQAGGLVLLRVHDMSTSRLLPTHPEALDESGRGLLIVASVSHAWGLEIDQDGGKCVWASFLSSPVAPDEPGSLDPRS